jgi:DnaJ-class molecular chaperone
LALKYHPELSKLDLETSKYNFCSISEAYEVLSDNIKRSFFDKFGEEKLKEGIFINGQLEGGYRFKSNSLEIFEQFILNNNNLSDMFDNSGQDDHGSMFGHSFGNMKQLSPQTVQNKIVNIQCTLNELFNGCSKTVTYSREILNKDGKTTTAIQETRAIEIKPGFNSNSNVCFSQ